MARVPGGVLRRWVSSRMPNRLSSMASRQAALRLLAILAVVASVVALAACGSHGSAAPLEQPAHVALAWQSGSPSAASAAGTAMLTPFHAAHLVVYLGANEIAYKDPKTPLQLRNGDCAGPVLAPLTENAPVPSGTQPPLVWPDGAGGVDVGVSPSDQLWVTLLGSAGANPTIMACGHPLSGNKQYFDLLSVTYNADHLLLGHTLATALSEPIPASRVDVSLAQPASGTVTWAVHTGSCAGGMVASGQFPSGATRGGILFAEPDTSTWWLSVTSGEGSGAKTACGKVGS